jgi:hypothetical protein
VSRTDSATSSTTGPGSPTPTPPTTVNPTIRSAPGDPPPVHRPDHGTGRAVVCSLAWSRWRRRHQHLPLPAPTGRRARATTIWSTRVEEGLRPLPGMQHNLAVDAVERGRGWRARCPRGAPPGRAGGRAGGPARAAHRVLKLVGIRRISCSTLLESIDPPRSVRHRALTSPLGIDLITNGGDMSRPSTEAEYLTSLLPPSVAATGIGRRSLLRGALAGAGFLGRQGFWRRAGRASPAAARAAARRRRRAP